MRTRRSLSGATPSNDSPSSIAAPVLPSTSDGISTLAAGSSAIHQLDLGPVLNASNSPPPPLSDDVFSSKSSPLSSLPPTPLHPNYVSTPLRPSGNPSISSPTPLDHAARLQALQAEESEGEGVVVQSISGRSATRKTESRAERPVRGRQSSTSKEQHAESDPAQGSTSISPKTAEANSSRRKSFTGQINIASTRRVMTGTGIVDAQELEDAIRDSSAETRIELEPEATGSGEVAFEEAGVIVDVHRAREKGKGRAKAPRKSKGKAKGKGTGKMTEEDLIMEESRISSSPATVAFQTDLESTASALSTRDAPELSTLLVSPSKWIGLVDYDSTPASASISYPDSLAVSPGASTQPSYSPLSVPALAQSDSAAAMEEELIIPSSSLSIITEPPIDLQSTTPTAITLMTTEDTIMTIPARDDDDQGRIDTPIVTSFASSTLRKSKSTLPSLYHVVEVGEEEEQFGEGELEESAPTGADDEMMIDSTSEAALPLVSLRPTVPPAVPHKDESILEVKEAVSIEVTVNEPPSDSSKPRDALDLVVIGEKFNVVEMSGDAREAVAREQEFVDKMEVDEVAEVQVSIHIPPVMPTPTQITIKSISKLTPPPPPPIDFSSSIVTTSQKKRAPIKIKGNAKGPSAIAAEAIAAAQKPALSRKPSVARLETRIGIQQSTTPAREQTQESTTPPLVVSHIDTVASSSMRLPIIPSSATQSVVPLQPTKSSIKLGSSVSGEDFLTSIATQQMSEERVRDESEKSSQKKRNHSSDDRRDEDDRRSDEKNEERRRSDARRSERSHRREQDDEKESKRRQSLNQPERESNNGSSNRDSKRSRVVERDKMAPSRSPMSEDLDSTLEDGKSQSSGRGRGHKSRDSRRDQSDGGRQSGRRESHGSRRDDRDREVRRERHRSSRDDRDSREDDRSSHRDRDRSRERDRYRNTDRGRDDRDQRDRRRNSRSRSPESRSRSDFNHSSVDSSRHTGESYRPALRDQSHDASLSSNARPPGVPKDRVRGNDGKYHAPPPDTYLCNRCGVKGHWRPACPLDAPPGSTDHPPTPIAPPSRPPPTPTARPSRPPPDHYICKACNVPGHWMPACPNARMNQNRGNSRPPATSETPAASTSANQRSPPSRYRAPGDPVGDLVGFNYSNRSRQQIESAAPAFHDASGIPSLDHSERKLVSIALPARPSDANSAPASAPSSNDRPMIMPPPVATRPELFNSEGYQPPPRSIHPTVATLPPSFNSEGYQPPPRAIHPTVATLPPAFNSEGYQPPPRAIHPTVAVSLPAPPPASLPPPASSFPPPSTTPSLPPPLTLPEKAARRKESEMMTRMEASIASQPLDRGDFLERNRQLANLMRNNSIAAQSSASFDSRNIETPSMLSQDASSRMSLVPGGSYQHDRRSSAPGGQGGHWTTLFLKPPTPSTSPPRPFVPAPSAPRPCSRIEEYTLAEKLGEGTFGEVWRGIKGPSTGPRGSQVPPGTVVALKQIIFHNAADGMPITSLREIQILKELDHPSIVSCLDMVHSSGDPSRHILGKVYIVFRYMEHDLKGLLENKSVVLLPEHVKQYAYQLLQGTAYLHKNQILHRDIKSANLLINNEGRLQIADFGLARRIEPVDARRDYTLTVVTRWYRPPELLLGETRYHTPVDMWGVACVIGEMFKRTPIFEGTSDLDQLEKIIRMCGNPTELSMPGWESLSGLEGTKLSFSFKPRGVSMEMAKYGAEFADFMDKILVLNPKSRLTAVEAMDHPWFWSLPLPTAPEMMPKYASSHEYDRRKREEEVRGVYAAPRPIQIARPQPQPFSQQQQRPQYNTNQSTNRSMPGQPTFNQQQQGGSYGARPYASTSSSQLPSQNYGANPSSNNYRPYGAPVQTTRRPGGGMNLAAMTSTAGARGQQNPPPPGANRPPPPAFSGTNRPPPPNYPGDPNLRY